MMNTLNVPLSEIIKDKQNDADEPKKKTREDWRKAKELEEARKAGTAPAAVDEEGKDINPHIPQYISTAPWYYSAKGPTLKHQRPQPEKQAEYSEITEWYNRGVRGVAAKKYRKGACENCGAMTHKRKDCLERPRKVGAKYTNADIAVDEIMQPTLLQDYDGKRDRWNGYDPREHDAVVAEYRKVEEAKRQLKAEELSKGEEGVNLDLDDEDKYVDEVDMPGTKVDSKQRITVRNLRIREDTAKYLRNLDPNSAYYDPKTRAMRENPYDNTGKNPDQVDYAGENFVRFTGDTVEQAKAHIFAWEAYEKGIDVHLLAEPTKLEVLKKETLKHKEELKTSVKKDILDKYGGAEHLKAPPKQLLLAQTEDYVEYSRHGKVIKGAEKRTNRSKYEEDVLIKNHTSVWGSYWKDGRWGYKCCCQFLKQSYCLGEAGKSDVGVLSTALPAIEDKPKNEEEEDSSSSDEDDTENNEEQQKSLLQMHQEKMEKKRAKKREKKKRQKLRQKEMGKKGAQKKTEGSSSSSSSSDYSSSSSSSESEDEEEQKKKELEEALAKHDKETMEAIKEGKDERKRKYFSMHDAKLPSEQEMEAYYMKRKREDDPMSAFL